MTVFKRHFIDQEDVVTMGDDMNIAVPSQWGIGNVKEFIERAKKLNVKIEAEKKRGRLK